MGTFCLIWAKPEFFRKTVLHHLKGIMVFYLYAKNYKKWLNCSKDIAIWKIEWFDWSRALETKSREPEFSQTWGLHKKLDNNKTLHFRIFLATPNESILHKWQKNPNFGLILGTFGLILANLRANLGRTRFFPKNPVMSLFKIYEPLTSCKISEKTNEPIPR